MTERKWWEVDFQSIGVPFWSIPDIESALTIKSMRESWEVLGRDDNSTIYRTPAGIFLVEEDKITGKLTRLMRVEETVDLI